MSELPQTRQSLLVRLRENSGDAWSEFLEVYENAIYEFSRRRGLQDADAWDVTQEVLAAVENRVETWESDPAKGKFRGWLFRVARNIAVDKVTAQSRRAAASGDSRVTRMLAEVPQSQEEDGTLFWINYRRSLLHWAAEQIKPNVKESSWKSFWMTAVEGHKPEVVAEKLQLTVGSVYAAKFRIVARIKTIVAKLDDGEHADEELLSEFKDER